ncbi:MAG: glycosyltransferase family 2 protein [Pseudomonadota bacterium]
MKITVITTMRNEGPFVLEWLAYLWHLGVTHVVVYTNDCRDGTDDLLDHIARDTGQISHIRQNLTPGQSPQWTALKAAWAHPMVQAADWGMVCDVDEFPDIKCGQGRLADLMTHLGDADAITLPWRLFGNAGHIAFQDAPVVRLFDRCAAPGAAFPLAHTMFKTLFRNTPRVQGLGVHRPRLGQSSRWVDGSGAVLPDGFARNKNRMSLLGAQPGGHIGRDLVELRHYSLKSVEAFLVKSQRGLPNRVHKPIDLRYWVYRNFNDVAVSPLPVVPFDWSDAVLARHAQCVAWYKGEIDRLVRDPVMNMVYSDVILAGDSRAIGPKQAKQLYQTHKRAQRGGP